MRILIVDDDVELNDIITRKLQSEHYQVDSCFDGRTAVDYLTLAEYDGVVMDIVML